MNKKMRIGLLMLAGVAGIGLAAGKASAETQKDVAEPPVETAVKPTAEAFVGFYSKYVWRGFELSNDSLVVQPSLTVGYQGFSANFWSNVDTNVDDAFQVASQDEFNLNETDITLAYNHSLGPVDLTGGTIYYDLEGFDDSQELFLSATLDTLLRPTLTVYREIAHLPGWYLTAGITHSVPLKGDIALDLGAKASYWTFDDAEDGGDPHHPGEEFSDFHDGVLSASITFPVNEHLAVAPELYYSFALNSTASDRLKAASVSGDDDTFLYGGVSVSFSF